MLWENYEIFLNLFEFIFMGCTWGTITIFSLNDLYIIQNNMSEFQNDRTGST